MDIISISWEEFQAVITEMVERLKMITKEVLAFEGVQSIVLWVEAIGFDRKIVTTILEVSWVIMGTLLLLNLLEWLWSLCEAKQEQIRIDGAIDLYVFPSDPDLRSALGFYQKTLGYKLRKSLSPSTHLIEKGTHAIILQPRSSLVKAFPSLSDHLPKNKFSLHRYHTVCDAELMESCLEKQEVLVKPHVTEWGVKEMWFKDPCGVVVGVGEMVG